MTRFNRVKNTPIVQNAIFGKIKKRGNIGICFLFLLLFALPAHAQLEAANWYFGDHAGLDFNSGFPVALTDSQMFQNEGCATISDANGNLLFYTNGIEIYNANHVLMQNGGGLLGSDSSTQSAVIVPFPGNTNKYYVFAVGYEGHSNGLTYSVVDMTLDGGLGGVVAGEKNIQLETPVAEKITAVYHANNTDIWVIAHGLNNNEYLAYLITSSGINTSPVISAVGNIHTISSGAIGYLKASPDGTMLACAIHFDNSMGTELFDFDNATGVVSNPKIINQYPTYGIEFSPNSKILYCTSMGWFAGGIYQYDLTQPTLADIQNSETIISGFNKYAALQLGIDGKLYAAQWNFSSLSVINNPNVLGVSCNFASDAVSLAGKSSEVGLPAFIQSYFQFEIASENLCAGQPTQFAIETHSNIVTATWDFGDPTSGAANTSTLISPAHIYSAPGDYVVSADIVTSVGYQISLTDSLTILPSPEAFPVNDLELCDVLPNDGETAFDMTGQTSVVLGTQNPNDYDVSYHLNEADAITGDNELSGLASYTNVANPQTIYVRVTNPTTGCYDLTDFDLIVNPAPEVLAPDIIQICDEFPNDGTAFFDLTQREAQILNGHTGYSLSWHVTQTEAENGVNAITTPQNHNTGTQDVYVRIEDDITGCFIVVTQALEVFPAPDIVTAIDPLSTCEEIGITDYIFDLTSIENDLLANLNPNDYDLDYFENQTDAENNISPIANPGNHSISSNTTIWVRVTDQKTNCYSITSFDLIIHPLPAINTPAPLIICDDGTANGQAEFNLNNAIAQITGNNPALTVTFYEEEPEAIAGTPQINNPGSYQNGIAYNDQVWVRVENITTGCFVTAPLPLEVNEAPVANTPQPYIYCDPDNDGFGQFDLPTLDTEITGGVSGVTVTYHETLANAQNDVLDIASPTAFANTVYEQQIIYARVEAPGVDCFVIVEVVLEVVDSPQPVLPQNLPDLMGCDENGDGLVTFDLTEMEDDILASEAVPADFTLEYFASQTDIPNNPITVPSAHSSGSGIIYVVVTGLDPYNCTKQTSFELILNALPVITTPQPLELCDVNNPGDEVEEFNLTEATLDITIGDPSINIDYYNTEADALAGTNAIQNPTTYTNTINNETIYIRAEDTDTGCVSVLGYTLTLIVNPLPSPEIPTDPLEVCDADNDGFVEFDLAAQIPIIQNGEHDVTITFYYSVQDAESGVGAIDPTQPFQLTSANNQILYVRAENMITGCYVTGELELEVVPTPEIISLEDLYVCDDDTPNGFATFDLTENTSNILGSQVLNDVEITYHTNQADAEAGINAIAVPTNYTNTSNGQFIYVRIENIATECFDTFDFTDDNSFQLFVEPLPVVHDPSPLMVCDDDYGKNPVEQVIFDLTVKEGEISGQTVPPSDYEFTYYASEQDFQSGIPILEPTAYQNMDNPQTIYITVVNGDTQNFCEDYTTLTITVLPLPSPSETDQEVLRLEQCDDDNDGVAADPFDLSQSGNLIAGGENVNLHYYKTERAAKEGDTNSAEYIATPDAYTNEPSYNAINSQGKEVQVIYVRVESGVAGNTCFVLTQFEIRVIPAPVLNLVVPFGYTLCEDGASGSAALFTEDIARNLYDASGTTPDPSVIVPLLDQIENTDLELDNYTIHYYTDAAGTSPFVSGTTASTGDVIYVQVEYDDTGCTSLIGEIIITVEPRPVIPGTDLIIEVCSDGPGGTTSTIDLTQFDADVNPGAPANTEVAYYENMDAYNNGDAPIDPPSAYTTVENPQEIIAVVRDVNTLCESLDYSTILIEVNSSPMVDLSMYDGMIICKDLDLFTPTIGGNYQPIELETGLSEMDYTFEWSLDGTVLAENGPSLLVTQAGTYTITVTDISSSVNTSCTTTSSATILESNPPEFMVEVLTESFSEEHTITIGNVTGAGDYEFSVDQGPWMELGEDGTLTFTGISAGTHTVYGRDKNGCGTTAIDASIIDYPKFFTPNADGYNDTWNIIGIEGQPNAEIYIFDRYGKLLKQLSPTGPGWDGTYNGNPMPSSDYWFRVEYIEPKTDTPATFKAHFTLKR